MHPLGGKKRIRCSLLRVDRLTLQKVEYWTLPGGSIQGVARRTPLRRESDLGHNSSRNVLCVNGVVGRYGCDPVEDVTTRWVIELGSFFLNAAVTL